MAESVRPPPPPSHPLQPPNSNTAVFINKNLYKRKPGILWLKTNRRSSVCSEPSRLSLAASRSCWCFWTASGSLRLLQRPLLQPCAPSHRPELYKFSSSEHRPVLFLGGDQGWGWFLSCPYWLCCCSCGILTLPTPTITMTRSWLTAASGVGIRGESLAGFILLFPLSLFQKYIWSSL